MKKTLKIIGLVVGVILILALGALTYINTTYSGVDSELRITGFIANQLLRATTEEELIAFANEQTHDGYEVEDGIVAEERTITTRDGEEMKVLILRAEDAAPLREDDFTGLPPTFTYIGDQDIFRDETIKYVNALKTDGVDVEFHLYPGGYHCFEIVVPDAVVSIEATNNLLNAYKHAADNYYAPQN